MSDLDNL